MHFVDNAISDISSDVAAFSVVSAVSTVLQYSNSTYWDSDNVVFGNDMWYFLLSILGSHAMYVNETIAKRNSVAMV